MESAITYQFRIVLRAISPLIWRRLHVASTTTIADLHHILQIAFGWSDDHLHRFHIHGCDYGIAHVGGVHFRDNPATIHLCDLTLRTGERFWYEYDFHDHWQHDLRLERILPDHATPIPICLAGARAGPPEDCGGPWAFLALRQAHHPARLLGRLTELLSAQPLDREQVACELPTLKYWFDIDRFNRRAVNTRLTQYAAGDAAWRDSE